ncbi:MAG TPA: DoxX family protein [Bordetella sp.]|uniref:DoxX family protein n=1 Tax=Bordetella sp. TaxID=28081 RepID=UPI002ED2DE41
MNDTFNALLSRPWAALLARVLLTFPFWLSGLAKLLDFSGARGEMQHFGLEPTILFAVLTIAVQLLGSLLVITRIAAWLGAGALIVFTLLTIPVAHDFWKMTGEAAFLNMMFVVEHIGMVGGLLLAAILCAQPRPRT